MVRFFFFMIGYLGMSAALFAQGIQSGCTLHVSLKQAEQSFLLEELFSEWRFVPLESDSIYQLDNPSRIPKILMTERSIYVGSYDMVCQFNFRGKLIRSLRKGNSERDFDFVSAFTVHPDQSLTIYNEGDVNRCYLLTYDEEGQLRWKSPSPFFLSDMDFWDASTLILRSMNGDCHPHSGKQILSVIDWRKKEILRAFLSNPKVSSPVWLRTQLSAYRGEWLMSGYQTTDIYSFTPAGARLRYHVDVDGRAVPKGFWNRPELDGYAIVQEYNKKGYVDHIPLFMESENRILLSYMGGSKELEGFAWFDKQNGKLCTFHEFPFDPSFHWKPLYCYLQKNGYLIIPIPVQILFEKKANAFIKRFIDLRKECDMLLFIGKLK